MSVHTRQPDRKYRVTTDGGSVAKWNGSGTALLIVGADGRQLKEAVVRGGAELSIGAPAVVGTLPAGVVAFDVAADLQHVLVALPRTGSGEASLTVVSNWLSALGKR